MRHRALHEDPRRIRRPVRTHPGRLPPGAPWPTSATWSAGSWPSWRCSDRRRPLPRSSEAGHPGRPGDPAVAGAELRPAAASPASSPRPAAAPATPPSWPARSASPPSPACAASLARGQDRRPASRRRPRGPRLSQARRRGGGGLSQAAARVRRPARPARREPRPGADHRRRHPRRAAGQRQQPGRRRRWPASAGAAGVGLFRTEYLFLTHPTCPTRRSSSPPTGP